MPLASLSPDLESLALTDGKRIRAAARPDWRGRPAAAVIPDFASLARRAADADDGLVLRADPKRRVLVALRVLEDGTAPAASAAPQHLYLELGLARPLADGWKARLAPAGWLGALIPAGAALALAALLAELRLGVPLRRLASGVARVAARQDPGGTGPAPAPAPSRAHPRVPIGRGLDVLTESLDRLVEELGDTRTELEAHRARWHYALEGSGNGLWDWDMTTDRVYYSPRWKAMLGGAEERIGDGLAEWFSRVHPDDLALLRAAIERHRSGETPELSCELRVRTEGDGWLWVLDRGRIVERGPDGRALRMIGTRTSINDRKLAERSLAHLVTLETVLAETSRSLLAAQPEAVEQVVERVLGALARRLDAESAAVFALGAEGSVLRATHTWRAGELRGEPPTAADLTVERLPRWMETLRHGEDVRIDDLDALPEAWADDLPALKERQIRAVAAAPLRSGERLSGFVCIQMERETRHWRETELRALRFLADMMGAALERRKLELELVHSRQRVEEVALYDTLTGLPNRRLLAERMRDAMAAAEEGGTQLAVCYLDLDGFKPVNDTYGHRVGDTILIAAAQRMRAQVREADTVARLGGDEFVLLLGGFDSLLECASFLDRLIRQLGRPYPVEDLELTVTASAGVTLYPRDANDADTLLRHADHAMYQAKQRGRNRCRFFDTRRDRKALARRSQLERLADAIDNDELVLYYQPKVDMRQGSVIGAEALVRWQHPEQGLLPPGAFIPLMDGTDLQQRMDWWVLERALGQLDAWRGQGLKLGLSVNVSARSVQRAGFVEELGTRLARHRSLAPATLSLEILESEALVDLVSVASVIQRCQELGVRFALDDFGTGYSSLTYFRRLPAQVLKIDQTFVRDMLRSPDDRSIVEGVIGLAHAFQREVIAEGVESAAHGLMLLEMGCEHAQGYGVAEPMPPERLPDWIAGWRCPALWSMRPRVDWSADTLDLLDMESVHRAWVARLVRTVQSGRAGRPPELDKAQSGLGRWYHGEGRRRWAHLKELWALDPLLDEVHARVRDLIRIQNRIRNLDGDVDEETTIAALLDARDRFVEGLHRLQERVLVESGRAEMA